MHVLIFDNIYLAKTGYFFPLGALVPGLMCAVLVLEVLEGFFIWTEFWNKIFGKVGVGRGLSSAQELGCFGPLASQQGSI